jgi:hypothetical protein
MRKKLVATSREGGGTYEVTIDEQPAQAAGINPYQSHATSSEEADEEKRGIDIPEEVKQAVLQGDSEQAKHLLEQAGYTVQLFEIGQ